MEFGEITVLAESYSYNRAAYLAQLLAVDPRNMDFADAMERALETAQARLQVWHEREATKVVQLEERRVRPR